MVRFFFGSTQFQGIQLLYVFMIHRAYQAIHRKISICCSSGWQRESAMGKQRHGKQFVIKFSYLCVFSIYLALHLWQLLSHHLKLGSLLFLVMNLSKQYTLNDVVRIVIYSEWAKLKMLLSFFCQHIWADCSQDHGIFWIWILDVTVL